MGTDIHGVWQAKKDGVWVDVSSEYEQERHYQLFAVLAGVRNGRGFAGIVTGDRVEPIAEPRGFPKDFKVAGRRKEYHPVDSIEAHDPRRRKYVIEYPEEYTDGIWMGDHSHSWLTGAEMLEYYEKCPVVAQTGIIDRATYETWDGKQPSDYCGDISGPGIVVVEAGKPMTIGWTHVRVSWPSRLCEELSYFFDEVKRLVELHGEIRFVFGFDS